MNLFQAKPHNLQSLYSKIEIKYRNGTTSIISVKDWLSIRGGLIKSMYEKELCTIKAII